MMFSGRNACGECLIPGAGDTIGEPTLASLTWLGDGDISVARAAAGWASRP